jgi:DNA polymerase-3 subunit gamma/tau
VPALANFAALIALAAEKRDLPLKTALERDVRLVHFEDGKLEIALEPTASKSLIGDLALKLGTLTGRRWMVAVSAQGGAPTVRSQIETRHEEFRRGVQADPRVQTVLARFPGAQIVAVRQPGAIADDAPPPEEPAFAPDEGLGEEDDD